MFFLPQNHRCHPAFIILYTLGVQKPSTKIGLHHFVFLSREFNHPKIGNFDLEGNIMYTYILHVPSSSPHHKKNPYRIYVIVYHLEYMEPSPPRATKWRTPMSLHQWDQQPHQTCAPVDRSRATNKGNCPTAVVNFDVYGNCQVGKYPPEVWQLASEKLQKPNSGKDPSSFPTINFRGFRC